MFQIVEVRYLESSKVSGGIFFPRTKSFPLRFWKNGREWIYSVDEVVERARKWLKKRNLNGRIYLLEFDNENGIFIRVKGISELCVSEHTHRKELNVL